MYAEGGGVGAGGGRRKKTPSLRSGANAGARLATGSRSGSRSSGGGGGYSPPSQPSYSPSYYRPTSTSTGNYSGGGAPSAPPGGGNGPVPRTVAPKKPEPPTLKKYLGGDDTYQATRNELIRNFNALRLTNKRNRRNVNTDYATTKSRLATEKQKAATDMENDFAARGLFGTGEYASKLAEFEKNFQNQFEDASTSRSRNVKQLMTDLQDAKRLRNSSLRQARLEAIRRRAEKYGLK